MITVPVAILAPIAGTRPGLAIQPCIGWPSADPAGGWRPDHRVGPASRTFPRSDHELWEADDLYPSRLVGPHPNRAVAFALGAHTGQSSRVAGQSHSYPMGSKRDGSRADRSHTRPSMA